jgi:hypothetical protein
MVRIKNGIIYNNKETEEQSNEEKLLKKVDNVIKKRFKKANEINKSKSERRISQITEHKFLKKNIFFSYWNWANFFIISGARDYGKSFFIMDYMLKKFFNEGKNNNFWFRLTPVATQKLLTDNGKKFIDVLLIEKYKLYDKYNDKGKMIMKAVKTVGNDVLLFGRKFCTILPLSTFYNNKGESLFDATIMSGAFIVFDEFQREQSEKNTFDISYCFVNQLENVCRDNKESKVFLLGNTLSEVSDILTLFNFIPNDFGIYKLKSKNAVIFNLPNSDIYNERRKGSLATILMPNASTFTNQIENNYNLVSKQTLKKPMYIICFSENEKYTLWDNNVIKKYCNEKKTIITMKPFIKDYVYNKENADNIIEMAYKRLFRFTDLITQKKFDNQIKLLKNIK